MWKRLCLLLVCSSLAVALPAQSGGYWLSEAEYQFLVDSLMQARSEIQQLHAELLASQSSLALVLEELAKAKSESTLLSTDLETQRKNLMMLSDSLNALVSEKNLWMILELGTGSLFVAYVTWDLVEDLVLRRQ